MGKLKHKIRKSKKHRLLFLAGTTLLTIGAVIDFHMIVEGMILLGVGLLVEVFI